MQNPGIGSTIVISGGTVSTKTPLTPSSPTTATIGASSAQAVAANSARKGLAVINLSTNVISLGLGATAVLNSGITLTQYGSLYEMSEYDYNTQAINAIASGAGSVIGIQEFT